MTFRELLPLLLIPLFGASVAGIWAVLVKGGQPGWIALIPFYNFRILAKLAQPSDALFSNPFDLARAFGRSTAFGLGLGCLPFVFYPILGFGRSTYIGPGGYRR